MAYIRTYETTERETPVFVAHVRRELVAQSFWCGIGVPQPHRVVATTTDQPVPVGAERHTRHLLACPLSQARGVKFSLKIWTRRSRDR